MRKLPHNIAKVYDVLARVSDKVARKSPSFLRPSLVRLSSGSRRRCDAWLLKARIPKAEKQPGNARAAVPAHYWQTVDAERNIRSGAFTEYESLLDELVDHRRYDVVYIKDLLAASPADRPMIALRHDVDVDPVTGVRQARALARRGMAGSFYLLHTARYYGVINGRKTLHSPELFGWLRAWIVAGCELGLHVDAWGVEKQFPGCGPAVVAREIAWLRDQGLSITGTVAHASLPVYGAANDEVFRERVLWSREARNIEGNRLPIGALSMEQLDLAYEGTFAKPKQSGVDEEDVAAFSAMSRRGDSINTERWMRRFLVDNPCCDWATDYQVWALGQGRWVVGGQSEQGEVFHWSIRLPGLIDWFRALPANTRTSVVLHPSLFRKDG